jgi:AraC family transcriptional regulator
MYQHVSLALTPDGLGEAPLTISADGLWDVDALSVVRGWSSQPIHYGAGGVFMNAFAIVLSLTPTRRRTIVDGAVVFDGWAPPGAVRIQRPGENLASDLFTPFDQIAFYIPISTFQSILRGQHRSESAVFDIVDPLWRVDKVIDASMRSVLSALEHRSTASYHYINEMARTLAAHVLYRYGGDGSSEATATRDDGPRALGLAKDYIENNLEQSLTLSDMARAAGWPINKFRREFKVAFKVSPHQYVIRRRVDKACQLIAARPKPKFADIALECGFADQSHLSTTFRKVLGVSPARFMRQG